MGVRPDAPTIETIVPVTFFETIILWVRSNFTSLIFHLAKRIREKIQPDDSKMGKGVKSRRIFAPRFTFDRSVHRQWGTDIEFRGCPPRVMLK
jgi:hypothetical protein